MAIKIEEMHFSGQNNNNNLGVAEDKVIVNLTLNKEEDLEINNDVKEKEIVNVKDNLVSATINDFHVEAKVQDNIPQNTMTTTINVGTNYDFKYYFSLVKYSVEDKEVNNPPKYANGSASGFDIESMEDSTLLPGERKLIHTGLRIELPHGYECQIRSRSGLALKKGLIVLNSPGTIDEDYRGEIGLILCNLSNEIIQIKKKDRLAQGVIVQRTMQALFIEETINKNTSRGENGYGSTGVGESTFPIT
jgi:dUTP pyrophosphatase